MQKPVLFLDFDGPLFPERVIPHSRPMSEYPGTNPHAWMTYWEMDITSVRQLNSLHEIYQFDTVISSSWINLLDRNQIQELFDANNLSLVMHEDWCIEHNGRLSASRLHMVAWWLEEHMNGDRTPSHIILDDPWSGSSFLDDTWRMFGLQEPFIIDPNVGIDPECYKHMMGVVRSWRDDYVSRDYIRKTTLG